MTLSSLIEGSQFSDVISDIEKESLVKSLDYYQVDPDKITITVDPDVMELFVYPARKPVYALIGKPVTKSIAAHLLRITDIAFSRGTEQSIVGIEEDRDRYHLVHKFGLQWSEDSLVFPNSYYKVPQMSNVEAVFRRIRDKAGIENFTLHGLRHTYATMALKETTNAKFISNQLGHKSVKTTLDIYYNPNHEDKKIDVMKITGIDNFLFKAKENLEAEVEETYDETSDDESEEG